MKLLLRLLISSAAIAALVFFAQTIDWATFSITILEVPLWVWVLSITGLSASHWLRAGRLKTEWSSQLRISWPQAWGLMVKHSAWVVLAPFRTGEAIYVWALHKQGGVSLKAASISLLRLRIQDAWVVTVLSLCLFAPIPAWGQLVSALLLLCLSVWMTHQFWHRINQTLVKSEGLQKATIKAPALKSWFFAISNWVVKGCAVALPLYALLPVGFVNALQGAFAGELSAILPLQPPAGAGLYQAGVFFGLQTYSSVIWKDAIAAALIVHVMLLTVTLLSAALARILGWSESALLHADSVRMESAIQTF
jgi:hypothetical protein